MCGRERRGRRGEEEGKKKGEEGGEKRGGKEVVGVGGGGVRGERESVCDVGGGGTNDCVSVQTRVRLQFAKNGEAPPRQPLGWTAQPAQLLKVYVSCLWAQVPGNPPAEPRPTPM